MAFTAITGEDILKEEVWNACNFKASGAILAGQAVQFYAEQVGKPNSYVLATNKNHGAAKGSSSAFIGVAAYNATNKGDVGIYTKGKVTVRASGAITAGDKVAAYSGGYFKAANIAGSGGIYNGVALETFADDEAGIILLH